MTVTNTGELRFVWTDELEPMLGLGEAKIRRASHVEPDENGRWTADLSPVGGPVLGPFRLRGDALAAEVAWLRAAGF